MPPDRSDIIVEEKRCATRTSTIFLKGEDDERFGIFTSEGRRLVIRWPKELVINKEAYIVKSCIQTISGLPVLFCDPYSNRPMQLQKAKPVMVNGYGLFVQKVETGVQPSLSVIVHVGV
jgi:hypothetical protein